MLDLIIKEENKWDVSASILVMIRQAIRNKLVSKEDVQEILYTEE